MRHPFEQSLATAWDPAAWREVTVMLAVSGGADSVALARAMQAIELSGPGRLVLAHFNHHLRSGTCDEDAEFVQSLASKLGLALELGEADPAALRGLRGDGLEAAARDSRYEFLTAAAERAGARYVVTAHTADDQAETVLQRIVRGTGLAGLAGMPRARALSPATTLIRPMLSVRRQEVLRYLDSIGQGFREDAMNQDLAFTRNRIRHRLLPQLAEDYNPQVVEALVRLGQLAGEAQRVVDQLVADLRERAVERGNGDVLVIDRGAVADEPPYLVRELLKAAWRKRGWPMQAMGFDEWRHLAEMLIAEESKLATAKRSFPGEVLAERGGECLTLSRSGKGGDPKK